MTVLLYFAVYVCFLFVPVLSFDTAELRNGDTSSVDTPSLLHVCRCVLQHVLDWELPLTVLSSFLRAQVFCGEDHVVVFLTGLC